MKDKLKAFDYLSFVAMGLLIVIGTMSIWSAGNARAEEVFHGAWKTTLITALFGVGVYLVLAFVDYRRYLELLMIPGYAMAVAFLIAVLVFGSTVFGGRRWLWFFQPSEIAKLFVIGLLAVLGDRLRGFSGFLKAMAIVGVPAALILAEPDLGTTLTLIPAAVVMMFAARIWRRGLVTMAITGGIAALAVLSAVYEAEKPGVPEARREQILRYVPLKAHQLKRVKTFLFPDDDQAGAGYNLRQAKISIGSGGMNGKGLGKGESNHLKYLPQVISMNDFIFCVYAEETGFKGSCVLLSLFGVLLLCGCRAAYCASTDAGSLFALGFTVLVFAHVYINIAMSIGIVPITGLPLPFISSGRTFLMTVLFGFGIIQSITIHRKVIT